MLSRGKSRDRVSLSNFNEDQIKVNLSALEEMYGMQENALCSWNHPLQTISRCICFHNIRSWNKHVEHFCSNRFYAEHLKIIFFVEKHLINPSFHYIGKYLDGWSDVHKDTKHGPAICCNPKEVKVICELDVLCPMEMLPVIVEVCQERILLVVFTELDYWEI